MDPCKDSSRPELCSTIGALLNVTQALTSTVKPALEAAGGAGGGVGEETEISEEEKLITDDELFILEIFFYIIGCGAVGLLGVVTNTLNIIVFIRQGLLSDSSTVSLFGLAVSDLFCQGTLFWVGMCTAIVFSKPKGWNWVPKDIGLLTGALPHVIFAQITCWITAYIAFERCMCVVFPFKMKTLFIPKRSAIIIPIFFIYNFASYTPLFLTQSLRWMTDPETNITKLVAYNNDMYEPMQELDNYLNSLANRLFPIVVVLICTAITTVKVRASQRWRHGVSAKKGGGTGGKTSDKNDGGKGNDSKNTLSSSTSDTTGVKSETQGQQKKSEITKEDKLVRMITMISFIFLLCYSSDIVMVFVKYLLPEVQHNGKYHNLMHLGLSLQFFLESINSSINIFVYYNMSSRYKQEFRKLVGWNQQ